MCPNDANVDRRVFNPEQPSGSGQPLASLYENYFTSYGTSVSNWKFAPGLGERVGDWYRVGYTKENTVAKAEQSPYINTGVVFKASYGPKKCIVYDPVSGKAIERTGLDGAPFRIKNATIHIGQRLLATPRIQHVVGLVIAPFR